MLVSIYKSTKIFSLKYLSIYFMYEKEITTDDAFNDIQIFNDFVIEINEVNN